MSNQKHKFQTKHTKIEYLFQKRGKAFTILKEQYQIFDTYEVTEHGLKNLKLENLFWY